MKLYIDVMTNGMEGFQPSSMTLNWTSTYGSFIFHHGELQSSHNVSSIWTQCIRSLVNFITYLEPPSLLDDNYIVVPLPTSFLWMHILMVKVCKNSSQCRWDKEVGFPLAQHWIEQSSSSSTGTILIVQTWGMCCRVGFWSSCTTWQIRCTLRGRARNSKKYAGVVEPVGWIWCTCWCESNFRYQSHWEFRSSSVVALSDALPSSLWTHLRVQVCGNAERVGTWSRSLAHNTWRGGGACWSSGMGLGRIDKLIHSHGPAHNPHKVVSA
jgi:hypothetical protein